MPRKAKSAATNIPRATLLTQGKEGPAMETLVTDESLAICNMQSRSRLFGVLPPELRNDIFELATLPYDDDQHVYKSSAYYYRPGHHAKQQADTALLLTCRRAWLEANHLPTRQFVPTFWFRWDNRRPEWTHETLERKSKYSLRRRRVRKAVYSCEVVRYRNLMESLTTTNKANLTTVHFLGQLLWLESNSLSDLLKSRHGGLPKVQRVKMTVRHTDWWMWENAENLHMDCDWLEQLLSDLEFANAVNTFELELETLYIKVPELRIFIDSMKREQGTITEQGDSGRSWRLDADSGKEVLAWQGPTNVGGYVVGPYAGMEKLEYRVHSLVWRCHGAQP